MSTYFFCFLYKDLLFIHFLIFILNCEWWLLFFNVTE